MAVEEFKRRLTAILSADVEGYSRLMREDEQATVRTLTTYRAAITHLIEQYRGRVVDSPGDNILAEFSSVVDAVNCGVEIQRELAERNAELPQNRQMRFRIGINLGDVLEDGKRIYGDGVNIAARMEGLAEAGGITISGTVHDAIESKIGLEYEYLGEQEVKNIDRPVRAYRVLSYLGATAHRVVKAKSALSARWRRAGLVALAIIVIVVGAGFAWHFFLRPAPPSVEAARMEKMAFPLPDKPSIAVLPFANMSGNPDQEYFCDGITDQIITSLSMIPRLFVIARNSTFTYKGKAVKVQKVAEEQGVRYVLEGSVQKSEDRVRILVQLIDAIKGVHLWSERYDRDLKNLFALQDEIAMKVMTALQVKLTEGDYAKGVASGTSNLKALECFWHADELFFHQTKEDNAASREWAEKAIEADSNFASAWALLGWTHMSDVFSGWGSSPAESMKRAEECAQKAISINASTAKALSLMGFIRLNQRNYDQAVEYGERAVAINPNDPTILQAFAAIVGCIGKYDEAIALIKKAMRICPYYPASYLLVLAGNYNFSGRYQEAVEACELLLDRCRKGEFNPFYVHISLAYAYVELGQLDKARAEAEEVLKIHPTYSLESDKFLWMSKDSALPERRLAALRKVGLK